MDSTKATSDQLKMCISKQWTGARTTKPLISNSPNYCNTSVCKCLPQVQRWRAAENLWPTVELQSSTNIWSELTGDQKVSQQHQSSTQAENCINMTPRRVRHEIKCGHVGEFRNQCCCCLWNVLYCLKLKNRVSKLCSVFRGLQMITATVALLNKNPELCNPGEISLTFACE